MYSLSYPLAPSFVHIFSQRFQYLCFARRLAFSTPFQISAFHNISNPFFGRPAQLHQSRSLLLTGISITGSLNLSCSVFDYPRSRTRSIEWMTNRCVSDGMHLHPGRYPRFYSPSGRVRHSAVQCRAERFCKPVRIMPGMLCYGAPQHLKVCHPGNGSGGSGIPKGAMQYAKHFMV